jgi:hypothetical protein
MNLSAPELLADDSIWDEHWIEQYLIYSSVFNDGHIREAMKKHRKRFRDKGIFSAQYEMGGSEE